MPIKDVFLPLVGQPRENFVGADRGVGGRDFLVDHLLLVPVPLKMTMLTHNVVKFKMVVKGSLSLLYLMACIWLSRTFCSSRRFRSARAFLWAMRYRVTPSTESVAGNAGAPDSAGAGVAAVR